MYFPETHQAPHLLPAAMRSTGDARYVICHIQWSKVDYYNVAFAGLARCDFDQIQSVLIAPTRQPGILRRWSYCVEQFASGHPNCTDNIYIQESA